MRSLGTSLTPFWNFQVFAVTKQPWTMNDPTESCPGSLRDTNRKLKFQDTEPWGKIADNQNRWLGLPVWISVITEFGGYLGLRIKDLGAVFALSRKVCRHWLGMSAWCVIRGWQDSVLPFLDTAWDKINSSSDWFSFFLPENHRRSSVIQGQV